MPQWVLLEPVRHQLAISGRVINAQTKKAIGGGSRNDY